MPTHFKRNKSYQKRLTIGLAAVAALPLLLSGCAGKGASSAGSGDSNAKITLDFWNGFTGPDGPALQKVVDDFNKSQSRITVKSNTMPWDTLYQKVLTAAAGQNGPDIVAMSASRLPQVAAQGLFQTSDDYYLNDKFGSNALSLRLLFLLPYIRGKIMAFL